MERFRFDGHDTDKLAGEIGYVLEQFSALAEMPETAGFYGGSPMSHLPGEGYRANAARVMAQQLRTRDSFGAEISLNGAGLKLRGKWESPKPDAPAVLCLRVGGDQDVDYPYFVRVASDMLTQAGYMSESERRRIDAYIGRNGRERKPLSVPASGRARPNVPAERPAKLEINLGADGNTWHYVLHKRRDGSLIPQVVAGRERQGDAFPPETPVSEVVAHALAVAARKGYNITQIDVRDPQRKLLTTGDCKTLKTSQLQMMITALGRK